ncbi:MAG: hypothetical protein V2J24_15830, partial [Pseudomonadales bacterium]|nr:hypothetical protein [Pseudomonadales bacterium]
LEAGALREFVADAWLPFAIDAGEAVDHVRRLAGARTQALQATALHLPFWRFDLSTRTRAQGERGTLGEVAALEPGQSLLAWEPVEEEIDLAYEDLLVPSASLPADLAPAGADWSWALEEAVPAGGDEPQARVVLDRSLPEAFAVALGHLQRELHGRVVAAIGGLDQRAVRTSTRYRRVQADTVLLPHWCVVEHDGDEGRSWLVNGQNGAVRALRGGVARGGPERGEGRAMAIEGRVREADALAPSTSNAVSVFAGAGIGLMVGSMLGLAVPPGDGTSIVAYFVAAVGGALAALLGLNDAHFSTAKGLRIGAFGLAVVLAAPTGIYVRAHGLLGPDLDAQRTALEAEGLEPAAAAAIVEARAAARGPVGLVGEQGFAKRCEDFDPAGFGGEVELVLQAYSLRGAPWADVAETIGAMPAAHRRDALYAAHAAICSLEDELAERSRGDGS